MPWRDSSRGSTRTTRIMPFMDSHPTSNGVPLPDASASVPPGGGGTLSGSPRRHVAARDPTRGEPATRPTRFPGQGDPFDPAQPVDNDQFPRWQEILGVVRG